MRKKWILPIVMALFTLPFFSGAVFAEEAVVFEEGEYKLPFEVKHGTEDKVSAADGYLTKPAKLTVKDGNNYIQMEITNSSMIKSLTVPSGEVDLISEDAGKDTRIVGFKTDKNLSEPLVMKMHVVVPGIYEANHTARAFFDVSGVPVKEEVVEEEKVEPEKEPAKPAEPIKIDVTDGFYTINGSFLHIEEEKASSMGRYLDGSMFLEVVNGKVELTVTVSKDETVTLLNVDGRNAIKSKVDGEKRYDTYELGNLTTVHKGYVEYQSPMKDGSMHYGNAEFRISLAKDSIVKSEATAKPGYEEEPVEEEKEEKEKEKEKEESQEGLTNLADGFYTIKSSFLHLEEEKASAMARHLGDSMFLEVVNGKVELTVTVNADETVTLLKVDGKNAIQSKIDGKKRYDTYKLDSLATTHHGYVDYQMGSHRSNANFRIVLDKTSIEGTTASNKPGVNLPETGGDLADKEGNDKPEEKEENDKLVDKVDVNKPADKKEPKKKNQLVPDKAYEIDFVIKHDKEDKASAANSFFKGPAILLEKDGQKYLQITVTGKEYIDWLKNKFGEMVVVKENKNSIVYQLKLDGGLSDAILLEMQITVPEIPGYEGEVHKARLFLDESSMREVDASTYRLVASSNENGPTVEGEPDKDIPLPGAKNNSPKKDNKDTNNHLPKTNNNDTNNNKNTKNDPTIEKPKFGSNGANKSIIETVIAGKEKNPQTGDTTNILLYVLLLIGSAIPLAVMAKRRFAKVA